MRRFFRLREQPTAAGRVLAGALCLALIFGLWLFLTWGAIPEERIVSPAQLPSVSETAASFHSLWFDRALTRNVFASIQRVLCNRSAAPMAPPAMTRKVSDMNRP